VQVPDEEPARAVELEGRDVAMAAGVGVQRLLRRPEGIEQREAAVPLDVLVVPLEQELERNRHPRGRAGQRLVSQPAEDRGGDPGLDRRQRHPDRGAKRQSPVADLPAADLR
jgi:hypothetical protein